MTSETNHGMSLGLASWITRGNKRNFLVFLFLSFDSLKNHPRDMWCVCHKEVRENEVCKELGGSSMLLTMDLGFRQVYRWSAYLKSCIVQDKVEPRVF